MTNANPRRPRVRYASRAAPGPPENETKTTASPMRTQGARKPTISMRTRMLPVQRTLPALRGGRVACLELAPHPVERVADQARHVHLRDPHPVGDLGLREPLEEAQVEDRALARRQPLDPGGERDPLLRLLEVLVLLPQCLHRAAAVVVRVGPLGQREGGV